MHKCTHLKGFSIFLALVMLLQMLPMPVFASEEALSAALSAPEEGAPVDAKDVQIVQELTDQRTENTKQYLMSDGLRMAVVYPEAVHYEKDGQWVDIDNTLVSSGGRYRNTAGGWNVSLPGQLSSNDEVTVTKDGHTLQFRLSGELLLGSAKAGSENLRAQSAGISAARVEQIDLTEEKAAAEHPETVLEKLCSRIRYASVYSGTDIIYDLTANQLKESIVMEVYRSELRGYRYTLDSGDLTPVLNDDGSVDLFAPTGKEVVLHMPAPYLVDDSGAFGAVDVTLAGKDGTYTLTYLPDSQWLASEDRAWPVILDPVITATATNTISDDQTVYQNTNISVDANVTTVTGGYETNCRAMRFYIRYNTLPAITSSDVVVSASIRLYAEASYGAANLQVHKVTGDWSGSTLRWNNQPSFDTNATDFTLCSDSDQYFGWDITEVVQDWYSGDNYGLVFKLSDTMESAQQNGWVRFFSSNINANCAPTLTVVFRNNNGLESYWDYTSSSAGRAGTGYVSNFTGNLTWVHSDIGFGGNRMPVSISHIYNLNDVTTPNDQNNSNDTAGNAFGMGVGWRTNFNQLLYRWRLDGSDTDYYIWEDSDGTDHYFTADNAGTLRDEDGLELTLTTNGSGTETYCITDKQGNTTYFDASGRLTKISNNQATKSSIAVAYSAPTGRQIASVTDGAGRVYSFTYTNGLLSRISYKGNGTNELSYVCYTYTGSLLTGITYKDGKSSSYTYNSANLLTCAQDVDGYKLTYSYNTVSNTWQPYRVQSIAESHNTAAGGAITLSYSHNQTILTDHDGHKSILQFNDFGNLTGIQDGEGRAQLGQYTFNTDAQKSASTNPTEKGNQLRLSSNLQTTVSNALRDSSFENGNHMWTAGNANSTMSLATNEHYFGGKSLKLNVSASGSGYLTTGPLTIPANTPCTFSAYVKTGMGSAWLSISDGSTTVSSAKHTGTTWTRLEVTYCASTDKDVYVQFWAEAGGAAYMDCAQQEFSASASRYNLLDNGDFRFWDGDWSVDNRVVMAASPAPMLEKGAYPVVGNYTSINRVSQVVEASGQKGDSFVLAGWATGNAVPLSGARKFGLILTFNNTDGTKTTRELSFNPDIPGGVWQYASVPAVADKAYSSMIVSLAYDYSVNTVYFDGIQLFKDTFGTSYSYDENGNVTKVTDPLGQTTAYEYQNNNLTKEILPSGASYTYTYDAYHNVKTATATDGRVYGLTYDTYGNNTKVETVAGGLTTSASAVYTEDRNRLASVTDALGRITRYSYNQNTNVLEWVQNPGDTEASRTNYTYDNMYRPTGITSSPDSATTLTASYSYTNDLLSSVTTGSTTYSFTYGNFALPSAVKIGSRTLASYTYTNDRNFRLASLSYGNGDSVRYTYDSQGRIIKDTYETGSTVSYTYDNDSALATVTDSAIGRTARYYYDLVGRLASYSESGNGHSHTIGYSYDALGYLTGLTEQINGQTYTTGYTYDTENSRLLSTTAGAATRSFAYDALGRVTSRTNGAVFTESYEYTAVGSATSGQVSKLNISATGLSQSYAYSYDANGNILSVSDGTHTTRYTYDKANQLIREDNQAGGFTHVWTYDNAGNILTRTRYAYTTGTLGAVHHTASYTYGDSTWGDLLTSYDGRTITSDAIGNTLSDGIRTYTWEHGRQLATLTKDGVLWGVDYDTNGMRCVRTNGTTRYEYVYHGSQLVQMKRNSDTLSISYDGNGAPMTLTYGSAVYYYVTNLQGDVVALLDGNGNPVVRYTYDAWGRPLSTTGSLATTVGALNPLRYRGYVYDTEWSLYYLQSRYYDADLGRFINADAYTSTGQGVLGNNMFAYCGNNPVMRADPSGDSWVIIPIFIAIFLSGCSDSDDFESYQKNILEAPGIDVAEDDPQLYNCFGNALGKYINEDPFGFAIGNTTKDVYLLVQKTVGKEYIRPLESINSPIDSDEYRVALKCGPSGYHFIRQDETGWVNKAGAEYLSVYVSATYVDGPSWGGVYMFNGKVEYEEAACYTSPTFYFAIKKGWDK